MLDSSLRANDLVSLLVRAGLFIWWGYTVIMVDRTVRDRLAAVIEGFLSGDISSFEFADHIDVADETDDETAHEIGGLLWYHFDDISRDHKTDLSPLEWDYFQRLLLLLRSDAILMTSYSHRWTWRQAVALAAIVVFVVGVFLLGFGWQLLLLSIPLGALSMGLSRWATEEAKVDPDDDFVRLTPYASVAEMLVVRRSVPSFHKQRYPSMMGSQQIQGFVANGFMWVYVGSMWLVFSPIVLLFQTVPPVQGASRVVLV